MYFVRLVIVILAFTVTAPAAEWPLKGPPDFSSGFGDYRLNRFHAGVDLRTRGKTGIRVYSPVNGYVWRIKMSYDGYGKGLYLKNVNGHIYVLGHLQDFSPKIDSLVKAAQVLSKRYYQDLYFPPDSVPVSRGEVVGLSGRTGGTAPHLHFELRNPDNLPLNPFLHNFPLNDYDAPVFDGIIFTLADDGSLLGNAGRTLEFAVKKPHDSVVYWLDTVLYFNKPFGVLASGYDMTRPRGMPITPYLMALFYDNSLHYEVVMDTLNFDCQRSVNLEYDLARAAKGEKTMRRLFPLPGNEYEGSRARAADAGVFGAVEPVSFGQHQGKVVAMDQKGNITELFFDFIWGPEHNLYDLDSAVTVNGRGLYYLSPRGETALIPIDSVVVLENVGDTWESPPGSRMTPVGDGRLIFETDAVNVPRSVLRLHVFSGKCTIRDRLLTEATPKLEGDISVAYEVKDDGLLVTLNTDAPGLASPVIELYYGDSLLGAVEPEFYSMRRYAAFIPPLGKYERIDRIVGRLSQESPTGESVAANIYLVGAHEADTVKAGDRFEIAIGREHLYQPRFIEVRTDGTKPGYFRLLPEAFPCRADFELSMDLPAEVNPPGREGVCWWDSQDSLWVWLDNIYDSNTLSSSMGGGGEFQILVDTVKPSISQLSITDGLTYFNPQQEITFILADEVSGFEDDRNILIELDGEWMIPEYNPDTKICQTKPLEPLPDGRHELKIVATDRAGNRSERNLYFLVKKQN